LARSRTGIPLQTPGSKDARARATASLAASAPPPVNSVICSSVAGSMIGMTSPEPGCFGISSNTVCSVIEDSFPSPRRPMRAC
jgi:hypothetical protein